MNEEFKLAMPIGDLLMIVGEEYNFRNQPERLRYLGYNWSGNGFWHQFENIDNPGVVWCELLDDDLRMIERTEAH